MEVELPTGLTIDVGWDEDAPEGPFRRTVGEDFGDHFLGFHVRDLEQVVSEVQRLAMEFFSVPGVVAAGSQSEPSMPPTHPAPR